MRWLVVLAIGVGCSGGGKDGAPHWVFLATVNAGIGDQALDLSEGAGMETSADGVHVHGDDLASCDHSFEFILPAPLSAQAYSLGGSSGPSALYVAYRDCRFGDSNIGAGSGTFTVNRVDASCARPPCIDAGFQFSTYVFPPQGFTAYFSGHVSNY